MIRNCNSECLLKTPITVLRANNASKIPAKELAPHRKKTDTPLFLKSNLAVGAYKHWTLKKH
jgi:hypothetical protein